ncbi:hypothetical protein GC176_12405, partial [bacterium]|nr:hypothetical protein [bacterium]
MTNDSKGLPVPQFSVENPVPEQVRQFFGWPERLSTPIPNGYQCDTPDNDGGVEFQVCRPPAHHETESNQAPLPSVPPMVTVPTTLHLSDADRALQHDIADACPNATDAQRAYIFQEEQQERRWNDFSEQLVPGSTARLPVTQDPPPVAEPRFDCQDEYDRYHREMGERLQQELVPQPSPQPTAPINPPVSVPLPHSLWEGFDTQSGASFGTGRETLLASAGGAFGAGTMTDASVTAAEITTNDPGIASDAFASEYEARLSEIASSAEQHLDSTIDAQQQAEGHQADALQFRSEAEASASTADQFRDASEQSAAQTDELRGQAEQYAAETDQHRGAAEQHAAETDQHRGAAEQSAAETDQHRGAAEQSAAETDQHRGSAEQSAVETDQHRGAAEQSAAETDQHRGAAEQSAAETDQHRGSAEQSAVETDQHRGVAEQSAAETDQHRGVAEQSAAETDQHRGV